MVKAPVRPRPEIGTGSAGVVVGQAAARVRTPVEGCDIRPMRPTMRIMKMTMTSMTDLLPGVTR